jgi:glycerophosphoryl diester phosphodiesterase
VVSGEFIIQSHRGAGHLAAENTLAAFEWAWELDTCPEADLRTTRDGVIVAAHDADLRRVVPGKTDARLVSELTWAELAVATGGTVPRLEAILACLAGCSERRLYLDIKAVDLPDLARAVGGAEVLPQVILASPCHEAIRHWKQLCPSGETLLWVGGDEAEIAAKVQALREAGFAGITQLQIHVRLRREGPTDGDPFVPSSAFIRSLAGEVRARGILFQALPWEVATPELYARLLDLGVASFATDYPEIACRVVRERLAVAPAGGTA